MFDHISTKIVDSAKVCGTVAAKTLIKNNKESLANTNDDLFGEKFQQELKSTSKATQKAEEYFKQQNEKKVSKPETALSCRPHSLQATEEGGGGGANGIHRQQKLYATTEPKWWKLPRKTR